MRDVIGQFKVWLQGIEFDNSWTSSAGDSAGRGRKTPLGDERLYPPRILRAVAVPSRDYFLRTGLT
jgi:hypothetical protein